MQVLGAFEDSDLGLNHAHRPTDFVSVTIVKCSSSDAFFLNSQSI